MDLGRSEQTHPPESPDQHAPESESSKSAPEDLSALTESSRETTLVAVPVDPYVVHCQWEIAAADIESAKRALGVSEQEFWPVLRFYDVTNAARDQAPPEPSLAVDVQLQAGNWYVRSCGPDRAYRADLALKAEDGSFAVIASSNSVQTPPSAPSGYADEHWLPIRLSPRQPESATLVCSPSDLAQGPRSGAPSELAGSTVRLPIDMREEVRSKLAALYGERERETSELPLSVQSPLPIDMREEVRKLLIQLYPGVEEEPPALADVALFIEEPGIERIFRESAAFLEMKSGAIADLIDLNERSFTSGICSRAK